MAKIQKRQNKVSRPQNLHSICSNKLLTLAFVLDTAAPRHSQLQDSQVLYKTVCPKGHPLVTVYDLDEANVHKNKLKKLRKGHRELMSFIDVKEVQGKLQPTCCL